jgi:hypothetical protein
MEALVIAELARRESLGGIPRFVVSADDRG